MKTLFFSYQYLNGHGGGVYATRAYANAFAQLSDTMTLVYPYKQGHQAEGLSRQIRLVPVENGKSKAARYLDLLRGHIHRYDKEGRELILSGEFDTIVFNGSMCSFRLIDIAHKAGLKVITIHHNYEVEYFRDNSDALTKMPMMYWTPRFEGEAVRKSDMNLVLTEEDKDLLYQHYDPEKKSDIRVIGVFEPQKRDFTEPPAKQFEGKYVITGDLSAMQTYKSLSIWFDKYYDILSESDFFQSLTVAGKSPSAELTSKCKSLGIKVIPSPASMDEIVRSSDCYICPVELGGGLKLRIMDGLRNGKPVITHKVSARGYGKAAESGILLAYDDRDSFRNAIACMANGSGTTGSISRSYYDTFSYEAGLNRLKNILHHGR